MEEKDLEYVGFWTRVVATLIDSVLLLVVTMPLLLAFYGVAYLDSDKNIEGPADFILSYVFPIVAVILFWCFKQATPGKMAVRAKIVDAKTGGSPSVGKCIGRYFAYILSAIPFGLGYIWVAFDPRKQAWHDKLAGTVVVRPRKKDAEVKFE